MAGFEWKSVHVHEGHEGPDRGVWESREEVPGVFDEVVREGDVIIYVYDDVSSSCVEEAVVWEAGCGERCRSWFVDL